MAPNTNQHPARAIEFPQILTTSCLSPYVGCDRHHCTFSATSDLWIKHIVQVSFLYKELKHSITWTWGSTHSNCLPAPLSEPPSRYFPKDKESCRRSACCLCPWDGSLLTLCHHRCDGAPSQDREEFQLPLLVTLPWSHISVANASQELP